MTDDDPRNLIPSRRPGPGDIEYTDGSSAHIADVLVALGWMMLTKDGPFQLGPAERPDLDPLRDATALACWCALCPAHTDGLPAGVVCPDCFPCHASVLLELLAHPVPRP